MKLLKTSTLLLCMTASGCSYFQTQDASSQPAKAPAEQASSHSWWPFGKDDGQTVAKQATEQKAEAEHVGSSHWWWPFGKDEGGRDVAAKAAEQKAEIAAAKKEVAAAAEPKAANPWWWPFGKDEGGRDVAAKAAEQKAEIAAAKKEVAAAAEPKAANPWWWPFGASSASKASGKPALVQQKVTKEWLDAHEKALREAIAGSEFTLERRDNALIVIAPADYSFNPKRHTMLMPITLNPLGKVAKMAQADPQSGILVLGHTDSTGSKAVNDKLSFERAQSVAAIFRLSGLKGDQLRLKGVGSDMPRADNASAAGRAQNRRVEVLYTQRASLLSLAQGN
ncbi:OmpA family protein [Pseudomonas aeruginosa]